MQLQASQTRCRGRQRSEEQPTEAHTDSHRELFWNDLLSLYIAEAGEGRGVSPLIDPLSFQFVRY